MVKVAPPPGVSSTLIAARWASRVCRTSASPSPVPIVLCREVRLEYALAQRIRNSWTVVGNGHDQAAALAGTVTCHADVDLPVSVHGFRCIAEQVGKRAAQRIVVAHQGSPPAVRAHDDARGSPARPCAPAPRAARPGPRRSGVPREPAELRELARQPIEPLRLGAQHFNSHGGRRVRQAARPPELVHRDPHGRQRILDLMCHPARHLAECPQALRFELVLAGGFDGGGQLPQRLAQRFELGGAPRWQAGGEGKSPSDEAASIPPARRSDVRAGATDARPRVPPSTAPPRRGSAPRRRNHLCSSGGRFRPARERVTEFEISSRWRRIAARSFGSSWVVSTRSSIRRAEIPTCSSDTRAPAEGAPARTARAHPITARTVGTAASAARTAKIR